jgi:hypothetical protein
MIYPFRKTVFNCKQATFLSIKRDEGKITVFERVKLSYHLLYCEPCRRFIHQWRRLAGMAREWNSIQSSAAPFVLPDAAKNKMQKITEGL